MISEIITASQNGNSEATLLMVEKFKPLLKKFAYKLYYEDAYYDLLVDFIELIQGINLKQIHDKSEGKMVSYICKSIKNSYIKRLIAVKKSHSFILYSELSEKQLYYISVLSATYDEYFMHELPYVSLLLTKTEYFVIEMIYCSGYTAAEIASCFSISRQAVNQMKKRALRKLVVVFSDKQ